MSVRVPRVLTHGHFSCNLWFSRWTTQWSWSKMAKQWREISDTVVGLFSWLLQLRIAPTAALIEPGEGRAAVAEDFAHPFGQLPSFKQSMPKQLDSQWSLHHAEPISFSHGFVEFPCFFFFFCWFLSECWVLVLCILDSLILMPSHLCFPEVSCCKSKTLVMPCRCLAKMHQSMRWKCC